MKTTNIPRGPLLGAHMSIAGGVGNAFLEGRKVDCEAIQIFTKSSRQWASKPLDKDEIAQFRANRKETGITSVVAHDSYLLNLGSPDAALRQRSIAAFIDEMERCEILGVSNLIAHPGAHVGAGELAGIKTIAKSLDEVHTACPKFTVKVTLEITAGQGSNLGYRFEQISAMIDATKECDRLRVCFDTEHAFAAGYDLRTQEGYERKKATREPSANSTKPSASSCSRRSTSTIRKKNSTPGSTATSILAKALSVSKPFACC
jgi:deoxyribonuclease IV